MPFNRFRTAGRPVGRHRARPGDALDRRGHGRRRAVRHRLRQVADRGVRRAARGRTRVRLAGQQGQAAHDLPGQAACRPGVRDHRDGRHGTGAPAQRCRGNGRRQAVVGVDPDGWTVDHRAHPRRRHRPGHQHADRHDSRRQSAGRRLRDPDCGGAARTSPASPPCRDSPPRFRGSRRPVPASSSVRSLQSWAATLQPGQR